MPLMADITHKQGAVKFYAAGWEFLAIIKETGVNGFNIEGLDFPVCTTQLHAFKLAGNFSV